MSRIKALLAKCGAALKSVCSPFAPINLFLVPKTGYAVHRALAYGSDPRHKLDIYVPAGAKGPMPVLLFLYGGGWQGGDRTNYLAFGQAFASAGMVVAVADYRLYPQVKFPAFVEDCRQRQRAGLPARPCRPVWRRSEPHFRQRPFGGRL